MTAVMGLLWALAVLSLLCGVLLLNGRAGRAMAIQGIAGAILAAFGLELALALCAVQGGAL